MKPSDRFDSLIQFWAERVQLPFPLVKRQMMAESSGNPKAVSPCGARGLLQLMPATAAEVSVMDPDNPDDNLRGGTEYLAKQVANVRLFLDSSPVTDDILRYALASYNGGFGYVREALRDIRPEVTWTRFSVALPKVVYRGKKPDAKQMLGYVSRILPAPSSTPGTVLSL